MELIGKAKNMISDNTDPDEEMIGDISVLLQNKKIKKSIVEGLNEELMKEISEDNFEEEITKSSDMNLKIDGGIYVIEKY